MPCLVRVLSKRCPRSGIAVWLFLATCVVPRIGAAENWHEALARMPLGTGPTDLNRTNCVALLLGAFASNQTVKALIIMPGAADEFYMFRRARAVLTNANPTLLDAFDALTNQTLIRATFFPPLLLLHTGEDPLEPLIEVDHQATADKLRRNPFLPHVTLNDRDWQFLQPLLKKKFRMEIRPWRYSDESWHFYRHSLAAWNLTGWEALEAVALAGKEKCRVQRRRIIFEGDARVGSTPKLEQFPR